ncbi:hypothetical protein [Prescottella agglutinans]|uniref:hypothetical protein n=1 Tax=Prescottella agglutinans TaxID=1644129 RepID=UPI003D9628A4
MLSAGGMLILGFVGIVLAYRNTLARNAFDTVDPRRFGLRFLLILLACSTASILSSLGAETAIDDLGNPHDLVGLPQPLFDVNPSVLALLVLAAIVATQTLAVRAKDAEGLI